LSRLVNEMSWACGDEKVIDVGKSKQRSIEISDVYVFSTLPKHYRPLRVVVYATDMQRKHSSEIGVVGMRRNGNSKSGGRLEVVALVTTSRSLEKLRGNGS
jgi:hypothetical protein